MRSFRRRAADGNFVPEIVDRANQQFAALREILRRSEESARDNHCCLIVGAELFEHETPGEILDICERNGAT